MKRISSIIFFSLIMLADLFCQHDKVWGLGRPYHLMQFGSVDVESMNVFAGFNYDVIRSNSNICSSDGEFLFASSGSMAFNKTGSVMLNGNYLMDTLIQNDWKENNPALQGVVILPRSSNTYYIIYQSENDSSYGSGFGQPNLLHYAVVDMTGDNGLGEVVFKKQNIYHGYIGEGRLTACRHANGRDWWIIQPGFNNNQYHFFLASPDSVRYVKTQTIGLGYSQPDFQGQAVFSPDGSKYAVSTTSSRVNIMNFDRCEGTLSDYSNVVLPQRTVNNTTRGRGAIGCSFSSGSQYLYVNTLLSVYQIDLADSNRLHHIADWDSSFQWWYYPFANSYLTPNDKILIRSYGGGSKAFHVIHNPDTTFDAVNFEHDGLIFQSLLTASPLPNIPHYRIGASIGSPCDTIISSIDETKIANTFSVFPNPTNSYITVSLKEYAPNIMLTVVDVTGKKMHSQTMYLETTIDVSQWASGMYFVRVESNGRLVGVSKLMKE